MDNHNNQKHWSVCNKVHSQWPVNSFYNVNKDFEALKFIANCTDGWDLCRQWVQKWLCKSDPPFKHTPLCTYGPYTINKDIQSKSHTMPSYQLHRTDSRGIPLWFYQMSFARTRRHISLRSLELINVSSMIWPDRLFQSFHLNLTANISKTCLVCGKRSTFSLVKPKTGPVISQPQ